MLLNPPRATTRVLDDLAGFTTAANTPGTTGLTFAPVVRMVEGPIDPAGAPEYTPDSPTTRTGPSAWTRRWQAKRGQGPSADVTGGRACCKAVVIQLGRKMHHLQLPHDFVCGVCKARYTLEMQVVTMRGAR